jgi:DNA-binding CsgD family transcriptional regulator
LCGNICGIFSYGKSKKYSAERLGLSPKSMKFS